MNLKSEKLFIYGTLREPEIQKKAFGRIAGGVADSLRGYRNGEALIKGEKYPIILPDKEGIVEGLLIKVSPEELKILDKYEEEYERKEVVLESGERTWVYVLKL
jgi:gamma-glutamylcyclotransferase (GGCT)/AIG2-like uncharacterized protein YtfP